MSLPKEQEVIEEEDHAITEAELKQWEKVPVRKVYASRPHLGRMSRFFEKYAAPLCITGIILLVLSHVSIWYLEPYLARGTEKEADLGEVILTANSEEVNEVVSSALLVGERLGALLKRTSEEDFPKLPGGVSLGEELKSVLEEIEATEEPRAITLEDYFAFEDQIARTSILFDYPEDKEVPYHILKGDFAELECGLKQQIIFIQFEDILYFRHFVYPYNETTAQFFENGGNFFAFFFAGGGGEFLMPREQAYFLPLETLKTYSIKEKVSGWQSRGVIPVDDCDLTMVRSLEIAWNMVPDLQEWFKLHQKLAFTEE